MPDSAPLPTSEWRRAAGHDRAVPVVAQDPCRRAPPRRSARRDARDRPDPERQRTAGARLRHLGPLFRPGDRDRHPHRAARTAPAVDPGARRCRGDRRPRDQAGRQRPAGAARPARCRNSTAPAARSCAPSPAQAVTQYAYAKRGIVTPEMEYVAIRENLGREQALGGRARRQVVRRRDPGPCDAGIRARRDRARPGDHPEQHQPPGNRADDHRPQLPGEGQRQYRQLDRHLVGRRGGRQAGLGDALGRRHGHGPVDRAQHPHDPRMDHPQLAGADRHGADLSGAGKGRRQGRGADLGIVPRHADRAGRAGRRLLHDPCRRAARLHPSDRVAGHRHRVARRLDHGEMVPGASPGEFPLHAYPRDQRDHADL